jgi:hypothetical protein
MQSVVTTYKVSRLVECLQLEKEPHTGLLRGYNSSECSSRSLLHPNIGAYDRNTVLFHLSQFHTKSPDLDKLVKTLELRDFQFYTPTKLAAIAHCKLCNDRISFDCRQM